MPQQRVKYRRLLAPLALVEPARHATAADPDRVAGDPHLVARRDRRPPAAPAVATRVAEDARHFADRLALARFLACGRGAAGADVGLSVRVEHGERQTVGQGAILARPPVAQAQFVAGIQLASRPRRPGHARRHRLPQGVVGRVHEPRHLKVGHVERLAAFVEAVGLAVLGQPVGNLRPGDAEQVAQGVLVLLAVEPPQDRSALAGQGRPLRGGDRFRQVCDEVLLPGRVGSGASFGRHLTGRHAVMHLDPHGQVGGVFWIERQTGQVEPASFVGFVVAARAVVAEEGRVGRGGLGAGRSGGEQGQHHECKGAKGGTPGGASASGRWHKGCLLLLESREPNGYRHYSSLDLGVFGLVGFGVLSHPGAKAFSPRSGFRVPGSLPRRRCQTVRATLAPGGRNDVGVGNRLR